MKLLILILFFMFGLFANGQEVIFNGKRYEVKKDKIFLDGNDVTATLTTEEQNDILTRFQKNSENLKLKEDLEKKAKKTEKDQKKVEKKLKKSKKELKKKEKAQDDYDKTSKKLEQAKNKYEELKRKGKMTPKDEANWLEKIQKLNESLNKAKKRLKRN